MRQQNRRILGAIGGAALLCGAFGGATASAQAMPPPPVIVPSAENIGIEFFSAAT